MRGRLEGDADPAADPHQRHVAPVLQHDAASDVEELELGGAVEDGRHAARVADRDRAVERQGRAQHVLQLDVARRRHHGHVRDEPEVREVEGAVVRRAVVADEPGAVDGEDDRELLQTHVLDEHVEGALEEGRVESDDGTQPADREPGGEDDGVRLGDADVVEPLRKALLEALEARALGHGRGDRDDALVPLREPDERVPEGVRVRHPFDDRLALAVAEVERPGAVERLGPLLRRLVALALDGLDVHDDRAAGLDRLTDRLAHRLDVVPVDHAEVREAQLLEEHAGADQRLHRLLDVLAHGVGLLADARDAQDAALEVLAQLGERRVEAQPVEVELQGADVGADRHLVVVEDDDERRAPVAGVVQGLEGDPSREGAVAEHADHGPLLFAGESRRLGEAEPVADRRGGVSGADDVVTGLAAVRESRRARRTGGCWRSSRAVP